MKLKFENDFEKLLKDSLVKREVDPLEHMFFVDSFIETGRKVPQIKIGEIDYLVGFGSAVPVYDIKNSLIDKNGHEIIIAKGISASVEGYFSGLALTGKKLKHVSKKIDSEILLPGDYEARFVSVRPDYLSDGKLEILWNSGRRKHYIIPSKDLSKVKLEEQEGYVLNHKKGEISSLYPTVRY